MGLKNTKPISRKSMLFFHYINFTRIIYILNIHLQNILSLSFSPMNEVPEFSKEIVKEDINYTERCMCFLFSEMTAQNNSFLPTSAVLKLNIRFTLHSYYVDLFLLLLLQ